MKGLTASLSKQARCTKCSPSWASKLIAGRGRGELNNFIPKLIEPTRLCKKRTRHTLGGTQIVRKTLESSTFRCVQTEF